MSIFQSIPFLNGLSKSIHCTKNEVLENFIICGVIGFAQKWEIAVFPKFLFISKRQKNQKRIDKKEQIQDFSWLIINTLSAASASPWQRHWGL